MPRTLAQFRRRSWRFGTLCTVAAALSLDAAHCSAGEDSNTSGTSKAVASLPAFESARDKFIAAESGRERGVAATVLLADASPLDIQNLCFDPDDSVAILAAWRRLEIQMQAALLGTHRGADRIAVGPEAAREFLGFIEGRLRVPPPYHWMRNLKNARFDRTGIVSFPVDQYSPHNTPSGAEALSHAEQLSFPVATFVPATVNAPSVISIRSRETYEGDNADVYPTGEIAEGLQDSAASFGRLTLTGIARGPLAAITFMSQRPGQDDIVCLRAGAAPRVSTEIWRKRMDAYWQDGFKGAEWFTEFRVSGDTLFLFHCTHGSIGIEALAFKDGARKFSFNSALPGK